MLLHSTGTWVVYNKASEKKLVRFITTILGFLSLLIVKMLTTPVANAPSYGMQLLRYGTFIWRDVILRPAALLELGAIALIVTISNYRKVKEDRGFAYTVRGMFGKKNKSHDITDGEKDA